MELFKTIDKSVAVCPGWCTPEKARTIALLILGLKPSVSVEIGVFGGRSAIPIALAHKYLNHGEVICIDPWDNKAASSGYDKENSAWWKAVDMDEIYKSFMINVVKFETTKFMNIQRVPSDAFNPPENIGFLHVDGQHTDQAIRDVQRFASKVYPGGIVVMDDIHWENEGRREVGMAAEWLRFNGFTELFALGTGAVFQRG